MWDKMKSCYYGLKTWKTTIIDYRVKEMGLFKLLEKESKRKE